MIAGIFGTHVLTAEDGTSRHAALPINNKAGDTSLHGVAAVVTAAVPGVITGGRLAASCSWPSAPLV